MQLQVMFKKELIENWRNFKWIWVPIVFIIFAIMDLIMTYYMPRIIESVGGLPEGAVISIPMPSPAEATIMSFAEIGTLGILILVVISMGTISGEIKSGVYELILSKPVQYGNYITSKFLAFSLISFVSLFIGMIASWYYVNLLFGEIQLTNVLIATSFYFTYLMYVLGIVILVNTIFKSPGLVAFVSIAIIVLLSVISNIFQHVFEFSPSLIGEHVQNYLYNGEIVSELWITALIAIIVAIGCIIAAVMILRNRKIN